MRRHLACVLAFAAAIAVGGCTRAPGATLGPSERGSASSPSADIVPSPTTAPDASDCVTLYESIDSLDPTLENLRAYSRDVVVATVVSEGAPFWDSPTGLGPKPGERTGEGNEFYILTPYAVTIDRAVVGSRTPGGVTVVIEGGRIGCDTLEVSPSVSLAQRARYVLFLEPRLAADGAGAMKQPMVFLAFPIQADGTVLTPLDGAVSLSALTAALARAGRSLAP